MVITFVVFGGIAPVGPGWNARLASGFNNSLADALAIVALVGNHFLIRWKSNFLRREHIVALSRSQRQMDGSPFGVHYGSDLAIKPAFGAAKALIFLASRWVGGVLVNFHVRRIQMAQ